MFFFFWLFYSDIIKEAVKWTVFCSGLLTFWAEWLAQFWGQRLGAFSMFKNDKEWEWMKNQVKLFGLTALVLLLALLRVELLFFLSCLFPPDICLLLIPVELCNYGRTSMAPLRNVHACCSTVRQLPCAWAEHGFSPKFVRIGSVSLWIKKKRRRKKRVGEGGKAEGGHWRFYRIYVEMNQPSTFTLSASSLLLLTVHAK